MLTLQKRIRNNQKIRFTKSLCKVHRGVGSWCFRCLQSWNIFLVGPYYETVLAAYREDSHGWSHVGHCSQFSNVFELLSLCPHAHTNACGPCVALPFRPVHGALELHCLCWHIHWSLTPFHIHVSKFWPTVYPQLILATCAGLSCTIARIYLTHLKVQPAWSFLHHFLHLLDGNDVCFLQLSPILP